MITQDVGVALNHQADSLAQAEVQVDACTSVRTNLRAIPKIIQVVVIQVLQCSGNLVHVIIAPSNVCATAYESSHVEDAVRIPATEQVGEVEHEVQAWSYIIELVVVGIRITVTGSLIAVPATLALPSVSLQAKTEDRRELVA